MSYKIPILLTTYNRPQLTRIVFEQIRKIKPEVLYVSSDGSKSSADKKLVDETRKIIDLVDWKCRLETKFSSMNLGCKESMSSAIDWFFQNNEMGIILEDDCLPDQSFFPYVNELLNKYKSDPRVMLISGTNPLGNHSNDEYSYLFSYYGSIWGWATWKRAWSLFDKNMSDWPIIKKKKVIRDILGSNWQYNFREKAYDKSYENKIDAWSYAWSYSRLINSGLSIMPVKNLVENLGFGDGATHTKKAVNVFSNLGVSKITTPLLHPPYIAADREFDRKYAYKLTFETKIRSLTSKLLKKLGMVG